MNTRSPIPHRRRQLAFTMIEIAIAIGVIGFALVAIIGILPRGMSSQKDNREDTIVAQDAPYFMNLIRNGEMRTNGGVLQQFVESIIITNISANGTNVTNYINTNLLGADSGLGLNISTNDAIFIGLLSTPEFFINNYNTTNYVNAIVRAMSGSAEQQNGNNAATAFRYQLTVQIEPWGYATPNYTGNNNSYFTNLQNGLHEVRLRFSWPVYMNGSVVQKVGPNRQTYRSLVAGPLINNNSYFVPLYFFQPLSFTNAPQS